MTNQSCGGNCNPSSKIQRQPGVDNSPVSLDVQLNRRSWLRAAGVGLAALGFGSLASQAQAAGSLVKAGKASDVPIKSAKAYTLKGQYILVTQPAKGTFKAFSGICTHMGAQITEVQGTNLVCAVHGSSFSSTTGSVTGGPAPSGLKKFTVTNKAGTLYIQI